MTTKDFTEEEALKLLDAERRRLSRYDDDALLERAEEIVRDRIAEGGPCEGNAHFEAMVKEKCDELIQEQE